MHKQEWQRLRALHSLERVLWHKDFRLVAGVDEAGRGPLAGPVVAAAVVLREDLLLAGLNDSKRVSARIRSQLAEEIKKSVAGWGVGIAPVGYIERYNILQATYYAMRAALKHLQLRPNYVLVDGRFSIPGLLIPQSSVIKGDQKCAAIAAASIIAKTTRDSIMRYYDRLYPRYGFAQNKGYPTPAHIAALKRYGPCYLHRHTFKGVK